MPERAVTRENSIIASRITTESRSNLFGVLLFRNMKDNCLLHFINLEFYFIVNIREIQEWKKNRTSIESVNDKMLWGKGNYNSKETSRGYHH